MGRRDLHMPVDNRLYSMGRDVRFYRVPRKEFVGFYLLRLQKILAELPTGFEYRTLNQNRSVPALSFLFSMSVGKLPATVLFPHFLLRTIDQTILI